MLKRLQAEARRMSTRPHHSIEFRGDEQEGSAASAGRCDLAAFDGFKQPAPRGVTEIQRGLGSGQIGRDRSRSRSFRHLHEHLVAFVIGRREKLRHARTSEWTICHVLSEWQ
jgi:hypothetical protein